MRATVTDRRLEAIAGPPQLELRGPAVVESARSVVFVAVDYKGGNGIRAAIYGFPGGQTTNLYVADSGSAVARNATSIREHGLFIGFTLDNPHREPLGIGRSSSLLQHWHEPFHAATFDRALTDAEALAVARHLSLSLSLSGLTPAPSPLTPATSRIGAWQHESRDHRQPTVSAWIPAGMDQRRETDHRRGSRTGRQSHPERLRVLPNLPRPCGDGLEAGSESPRLDKLNSRNPSPRSRKSTPRGPTSRGCQKGSPRRNGHCPDLSLRVGSYSSRDRNHLYTLTGGAS